MNITVDGDNITSLLSLFFIIHLPELVINGKIYKVVPPLYHVNLRKINKLMRGSIKTSSEYLYNKREYYDLYNSLIVENTDVLIPDNETDDNDLYIQLTKKEKKVWLHSLETYTIKLNSLVKRSACDAYVIEYVCYYLILSKGDEETFVRLIEERYPELVYDYEQKSLFGSVNGNHVSLIVDALFLNMSKKLMQLIATMPSIFIKIKNLHDTTDQYEKMTIGEFLYQMEKTYIIEIEQRFKGLGEARTEILFTTTLNPKLRRLIRLNINDMEKCITTMELLHKKSEAMAEGRRQLLANADITLMDLDN